MTAALLYPVDMGIAEIEQELSNTIRHDGIDKKRQRIAELLRLLKRNTAISSFEFGYLASLFKDFPEAATRNRYYYRLLSLVRDAGIEKRIKGDTTLTIQTAAEPQDWRFKVSGKMVYVL